MRRALLFLIAAGLYAQAPQASPFQIGGTGGTPGTVTSIVIQGTTGDIVVSPGPCTVTTTGTCTIDTGSDIAHLAIANIFTANGAVSAPAETFSGTVFTGGSATTTKPLFLIEPTGTASTNWSTSGTVFGVNAVGGFAGNLIDLQVAAVSKFKITTGANTAIAASSGFATTLGLTSASGNVSRLSLTQTGVSGWNIDNTPTTGVLTLSSSANSSMVISANGAATGFGINNNALGTLTLSVLDRTATTGATNFYVGSDNNAHTSATTTQLIVTAGATQGNLPVIISVTAQTTGVTVSQLIACATGTQGTRAFVTDSNAVSFTAGIGAVVAAGGTTKLPVTCDGTNWRIG